MQVINAVGRRKTAVARVYVQAGNGNVTVNGRELQEYFPSEISRIILNQPFVTTNTAGQFDVKVNVAGGGIAGQAEAVRMAISRALVESSAENRPALKKAGFLTRDSRMVERKKYGRAKARKRFQFSKR